jgi:hypothetical protein
MAPSHIAIAIRCAIEVSVCHVVIEGVRSRFPRLAAIFAQIIGKSTLSALELSQPLC